MSLGIGCKGGHELHVFMADAGVEYVFDARTGRLAGDFWWRATDAALPDDDPDLVNPKPYVCTHHGHGVCDALGASLPLVPNGLAKGLEMDVAFRIDGDPEFGEDRGGAACSADVVIDGASCGHDSKGRGVEASSTSQLRWYGTADGVPLLLRSLMTEDTISRHPPSQPKSRQSLYMDVALCRVSLREWVPHPRKGTSYGWRETHLGVWAAHVVSCAPKTAYIERDAVKDAL